MVAVSRMHWTNLDNSSDDERISPSRGYAHSSSFTYKEQQLGLLSLRFRGYLGLYSEVWER